MTSADRKDGEPADCITDDHAAHICQVIADGYNTGAFPMLNDQQVGWYDWLRHHVATAMLTQRDKED